jgi:hypothetical protein
MSEIIQGEKLQQISNICFNPTKINDGLKHIKIINNPQIIFCYTHDINKFSNIIDLCKNNFVLITHNSDENIVNNHVTNKILNCDKLIKWYSQNVAFYNEKLFPLPIGFANSKWEHGNLDFFNNYNCVNLYKTKTQNVYFNFTISTNKNKRIECFDKLKDKLYWLNVISPKKNIIRLSKYKFCICPEGNGYDTHRLWESLYLQTIPIVIKNDFIDTLQRHLNLPMIILNDWNDFDESSLNYDNYVFDENYFTKLKMSFYKNKIYSNIL